MLRKRKMDSPETASAKRKDNPDDNGETASFKMVELEVFPKHLNSQHIVKYFKESQNLEIVELDCAPLQRVWTFRCSATTADSIVMDVVFTVDESKLVRIPNEYVLALSAKDGCPIPDIFTPNQVVDYFHSYLTSDITPLFSSKDNKKWHFTCSKEAVELLEMGEAFIPLNRFRMVRVEPDDIPEPEEEVAPGPADADDVQECSLGDEEAPPAPVLKRSRSQVEHSKLRSSYQSINQDMPDCAEKTLALLLLYFQNEKVKTDNNTLFGEDQVLKCFNELLKELQCEELYLNAEDTAQFQLIKTSYEDKTISREHLEEIVNYLSRVLHEFQPVDMALLLSYIADSLRSADTIKSQDIILLLGMSGAGKSTTIHYLAGSTLKLSKIHGQDHYQPVDCPLEQLSSFVTNPFNSETKTINAITIPFEEKCVLLCDSPGFEDTDGVVADISNGIAISRAIRMCLSVRPVLVVSSDSVGPRAMDMSKTIRTLTSLIPRIDKHLTSFSYLFTKYRKTEEEAHNIHLRFAHKSTNLTNDESMVPHFGAVIEDIVLKTKNRRARILDVMRGKERRTILKELLMAPPISDPSAAFQDFTSPSSLNVLKMQLSKHQQSIARALKRSDVKMLRYKLSQLAVLNDAVDLDDCYATFQICLKDTCAYMHDKKSKIFHCIRNFASDDFAANDSELTACVAEMLQLLELDTFRDTYFSSKLKEEFGNSSLMDLCCQQVTRIQSLFFKSVQYFCDISNGKTATNSTTLAELELNGRDLQSVLVNRVKKMKIILEQINVDTMSKSNLLYPPDFFTNIQVWCVKAIDDIQLDMMTVCGNIEAAINAKEFVSTIEHFHVLHHRTDLYVHCNDEAGLMLPDLAQQLESTVELDCQNAITSIRELLYCENAEKQLTIVSLLCEKIAPVEKLVAKSRDLDSLFKMEQIENSFEDIFEIFVDSIKSFLERISPSCHAPELRKIPFHDIAVFLSGLFAFGHKQADFFNRTELLREKLTKAITEAVAKSQQTVLAGLNHGTVENANEFKSSLSNWLHSTELHKFQSLQCKQEFDMGASEVGKLLRTALEHFNSPACLVTGASVDAVAPLHAIIVMIKDSAVSELKEIRTVHKLCVEIDRLFMDKVSQGFHKAQSIFGIDNNKMWTTTRQEFEDANSFIEACRKFESLKVGDVVAVLVASLTDKLKNVAHILDARWNEILKFNSHHQMDEGQRKAGGIFLCLLSFLQALCMNSATSDIAVCLCTNITPICDLWVGPSALITAKCTELDVKLKQIEDGSLQVDSRVLSMLGELSNFLVPFDKFVDTKNEKPSFATVAFGYNAILTKMSDTTFVQISEDIKSGELTNVAQSIHRLNLNPNIPHENERLVNLRMEIMGALEARFVELFGHTEALMQGRLASLYNCLEMWGPLWTNFSSLKEHIIVEKFVILSEELAKCHKCFDTKIIQIFGYLNNECINNGEYWQFEETSAFLKTVLALPSLHPDFSTCQKRLDQLRARFNEELKIQVNFYYPLSMDFKKQKSGQISPSQVLNEMKKFPHDSIVGHEYSKLSTHIAKSINDHLRSIRSAEIDVESFVMPQEWTKLVRQDTPNLHTFADTVKSVKQTGHLFPGDIYSKYAHEIHTCEEIVEGLKQRLKQRIDSEMTTQGVPGLLKRFKASHYKLDFVAIQVIKTKMEEYTSQTLERMSRQLSTGRMSEVSVELAGLLREVHTFTQCQDLGRDSLKRFSNQLLRSVDHNYEQTPLNICLAQFRTIGKSIMNFVSQVDRISTNSTDAEQIRSMSAPCIEMIKFLSLQNQGEEATALFVEVCKIDANINAGCKMTLSKCCDMMKNFCQAANESMGWLTNALSNSSNIELADIDESVVKKQFAKLNNLMNCLQGLEPYCLELSEFIKTRLCDQEERLKKNFALCQPHHKLSEILSGHVVDWKNIMIVPFLHNPAVKTPNAEFRNKFYQRINVSFRILVIVKTVASHVAPTIVNVSSIEDECKKHVETEIISIGKEVSTLLGFIPCSDPAIYANYNIWYDNLRSIHDNFDALELQHKAKGTMDSIDNMFSSKIDTLQNSAWIGESDWRNWRDHIAKIPEFLISLKRLGNDIPYCKPRITEIINNLLGKYESRQDGVTAIGELGLLLGGMSHEPIALMIINDHPTFGTYKLSMINRKTSTIDITKVLDKVAVENSTMDKAVLKDVYDMFYELWWSLVEKGLRSLEYISVTLADIVNHAKELVESELSYGHKVRKLIAHVFAFWTLSKVNQQAQSKYLGERDKNMAKSYLMQPHAAQAISIFRLFGLDQPHNNCDLPAPPGGFRINIAGRAKTFNRGGTCQANGSKEGRLPVDNHLVQIGTGEGKSITLAVTAIVMAMLGYHVDCACYSEYLSMRDHDAFRDMFRDFHVIDCIKYGTFNELCEDFLNDRGDIRESVQATIVNNRQGGPQNQVVVRPRILLIDEVDVFLNKDFYGNKYVPAAQLTSEAIKILVKYVWDIREDKAAQRNIKSSAQFIRCCQTFPGWEFIVEEAVKKMLCALGSMSKSSDYYLDEENGRIGYKDQDGISYEKQYGYNTLFAYFKENDAQKISDENLESKIYLPVNCGEFSYGAVPLAYDCIVGVTGTLATLIAAERRLLAQEFNIHQHTYIPSMYGERVVRFEPDNVNSSMLKIFSEMYYYRELIEEIRNYAEADKHGRAVIVFFESQTHLYNFQSSQEFAPYKGSTRVITETTTLNERESAIAKAVTAGSITLLTREFGRGTDFLCHDEKLNLKGGLHVIQTFVSERISEETQIRGRTGRQGNQGSFSMVLMDSDLDRFSINVEEIAKMQNEGTRYDTIHRHRTEYFEKIYPDTMKYVENIKVQHDMSTEFLNYLWSSRPDDFDLAKDFLRRHNLCIVKGNSVVSRTIILIDATGSMTETLTKLVRTVQLMFEQAHRILSDQVGDSTFQMQFSIFRNYNSGPDGLLQFSTWESDPENLRGWLNGIKAIGGQGNEAIEIGMWHVNDELSRGDVHQVILIGDMPPNSVAEVETKRGTVDWSQTPYHTATHIDTEMKPIIERNIPVHAIYVRPYAKYSFAKIAAAGKGKCNFLDVESPEGADMLTRLVTGHILENVGFQLGGNEMAQKLASSYATYIAKAKK